MHVSKLQLARCCRGKYSGGAHIRQFGHALSERIGDDPRTPFRRAARDDRTSEIIFVLSRATYPHLTDKNAVQTSPTYLRTRSRFRIRASRA